MNKKELKSRFNPLNQVYVFNTLEVYQKFQKAVDCFNPLNQVYVFNEEVLYIPEDSLWTTGFNPLNQVYVFNIWIF